MVLTHRNDDAARMCAVDRLMIEERPNSDAPFLKFRYGIERNHPRRSA